MDIGQHLPQSVKRSIPPRLLAYRDLLPGRKKTLLGEPFNAQTQRALLIRDLIDRLPVHGVVETGTFRGASTAAFASLIDGPVQSVEAFPRFFYFCRRRFIRTQNVQLFLGDSGDWLERLADDEDILHHHVLFYLDAHSSAHEEISALADELPLARELRAISGAWRESLVVIDDFRVTDDEGYGYDEYPSGALTTSYIAEVGLANDFALFYPTAPSSQETGARRGSIILATLDSARSVAEASPHLRKVTHPL
jgi:predicted O-methyltransferase YrrM